MSEPQIFMACKYSHLLLQGRMDQEVRNISLGPEQKREMLVFKDRTDGH